MEGGSKSQDAQAPARSLVQPRLTLVLFPSSTLHYVFDLASFRTDIYDYC